MKTPSNGADSTTVLAETQARGAELCPETIEVRDQNGVLVGKIDGSQAAELIARGWAEPIGGGPRCIPVSINRYSNNIRLNSRRGMKYLRLTKSSPGRPRPDGGWIRPTMTQAVRADQTCKLFGEGQQMGGHEHKPLALDPTLYEPWRTVVKPQ
jgi:hypothetical protein